MRRCGRTARRWWNGTGKSEEEWGRALRKNCGVAFFLPLVAFFVLFFFFGRVVFNFDDRRLLAEKIFQWLTMTFGI